MSSSFQTVGHFYCLIFPQNSELRQGEGNFFEKKQNKSCCFQNVFNFPAANFPLAAIFSFFAVAGKMGTARTFIPFPIMRMCRPACRRAKRCSGPFLERKSLHGLIGRKRGCTIPFGAGYASRKRLHSPRGDRSLIVHHTEKSERILFVDAFGFVFL